MSYTKTLLTVALLTVSCGLLMMLAPEATIDMMGRSEASESTTPSPALLASLQALIRLLGSFMLAFGVMAYVLREVQEPSVRSRILKVAAVTTILTVLCSTPKELGWPPLTISLISLGILLLGLYQLDKSRGTNEVETKEAPPSQGELAPEASPPPIDDPEGV